MKIRNDYHGTETTINPTIPFSRRRVRRIKARLCPVGVCQCSDTLGGRGPQGAGYSAVLEQADHAVITKKETLTTSIRYRLRQRQVFGFVIAHK